MFTSLRSMIGNTPLFRLQHADQAQSNIFLKLEQFNPGGSIKDRTALGMISSAEESGTLRPSMRIIESSSGNTAIGLAMLATERGYRVTAICDRNMPVAKLSRLRAYGADIVFLPETPYGMDTVELRIAVASYLVKRIPDSISLGQYTNPANPKIHYTTTGPEIWRDLKGEVSAVVIAVGTCGTITGVGRFIKEQNSAVKIIGVEPYGSIIFGGSLSLYLIQPGGMSFVPVLLDRSVVDEGRKVHDDEAITAVHRLAAREGWLVGGTAGLVLHILDAVAHEFGPGHNVVGIIPDGGDRYLDSLYHPEWLQAHNMSQNVIVPRADEGIALQAVAEIGCSLNSSAGNAGVSLEELCEKIGIPKPPIINVA